MYAVAAMERPIYFTVHPGEQLGCAVIPVLSNQRKGNLISVLIIQPLHGNGVIC